jgi:hypothetical protein
MRRHAAAWLIMAITAIGCGTAKADPLKDLVKRYPNGSQGSYEIYARNPKVWLKILQAQKQGAWQPWKSDPGIIDQLEKLDPNHVDVRTVIKQHPKDWLKIIESQK